MKLRSWNLWLPATLILILLLSACGGTTSGSGGGSGGSGSGPISLKIMVGGLNKQIYLPNMLTQQLGFFTQEGLNAR